MLKLQQIDQETFEKLRDQLVGGDLSTTHLVKGLDFKLLERVRRGENLNSSKANDEDAELGDFDEEMDKLETQEIVPLVKGKTMKKGEMASPPVVAGQKRTRDQILAGLKASRAAATAAKATANPSLGAKFKKVGQQSQTKSRIEIDEKGREVLIVIDEDGRIKRKVRRTNPENETSKGPGLLMPNKDAKPLGMEVPDIPKPSDDDDDDDMDIFEDAGVDYDPLAGLSDESSANDTDGDAEIEPNPSTSPIKTVKAMEPPKSSSPKTSNSDRHGNMSPPPLKGPSTSRNYFDTPKSETTTTNQPIHPLKDPTILAALKKTSTINPISQSSNHEETSLEERRRKMLSTDDRDAEDMDLGFGSSRFEDQEDGDDVRVKLSVWGSKDDDGIKGEGKGKRKRGPKKRKGDKNNAADVMKVVEDRKAKNK